MKSRSYSERYRRSVTLAGIAVVFTICMIVSTNVFSIKPLLSADAEVYAVYLNGEEIRADMEQICEVLGEAEAALTLRKQGSYLMEDYPLEISVVDNEEPIHILFGTDVHSYGSSGMIRTVQNGEEIYSRILEIINN